MNARANTTIDGNQPVRSFDDGGQDMQNDTARECANAQPTKRNVATAKFGELPVIDNHLFFVNPEIPAERLLDHARCLVGSVRETLLSTDDGIDGNQVWLLWNSLDQLVGVLDAIEFARRRQANAPAKT